MVFEGLFARARNGDRAAEATTQPQPAVTRPTIGLALGGGAARGFAHIGVMRKLLEHGIVPDVIVGTSIGAVVGGCYAAKEMDNLESLGPHPDRARRPWLSRHQLVRLRPDRRRPSRQPTRNRTQEHTHRRSANPVCSDRHGIQHRSRNMAHARTAERCAACVLCPAGNFSSGPDRRSLAGGWRTGQSRCRCRPLALSARGW